MGLLSGKTGSQILNLGAFPFDPYRYSDPQLHTQLTKEQWVDPTDSFNDFEFYKIDREEQALKQSDEYDERTSQEVD